jgi:hypothetical protein
MALIHVVYASEAAIEFSDQQIRVLLEHARRTNKAAHISGILLLADRSFFQILEGQAEAVGQLYSKISSDSRHRRVVKLIEEPIRERDFQDWSMGLARVKSKELSHVPGLNDFFSGGHSLADLGASLARKLLVAFRDGQWRSRLGD